ncbi:MAG: Hpt domain-containing protein, partial [Gallionella sp.]|nr:Hpt domain-containing protein [Gallionella sp.]
MINSARFDPDILAAVKPGVDGSLAEISLQMEQYLKAPAQNVAALEVACAEFHRLLGVLRMVGLDGLVVYCAEFEHALSGLKVNPKQVSDLYRDVLRRALFAVTHFLDALAEGADNATLRLFPQYQELQQLRGLEMAFELDLFYPNLAVQLPPQILKPPQQEGAKSRLKVLRIQYQQGLLKWLRQEDVPGALQLMQQAVGGAIFCEPADDSRGFWWISYVLLDCMKLDGLPPETNVRKLLGRIDQQMRTTSEGGSSQAGDVHLVMNEMLYLIGHSTVESDQVKAIRQVYSLDKYLPEVSTLQLGELEQQLGVMRDQLRVAEESWDLCVQGDKAACEKFSKYAEQIKVQSEKFDRDTLQYLAGQIQALSHYASTPEHARPIALDMAMALLLLASGIENYNRLGSGFQQQARILSERMHATVKQQPEDEQRMTELVDLHYQSEQQGDVMTSLANEMLVNLQHVEEGLNAFFNDLGKRGELAELLRLLNQIQGGFSISSLKHAGQLLAAIQKHLRRFSQANIVPKPAERYALADAMSALENYMQHLTHGQSGDVSRLLVAMADMDKLDQPAPAVPPVAAKPVQIPPVAPVKAEQPQVVPAVTPTPAAPVMVVQPQTTATETPAPLPPVKVVQPQEPVSVAPAMVEQPQVPAPVAPSMAEQTQAAAPEKPVIIEQPHVAAPVEQTGVEQPKVAAPLSEEEQELLDIFLEEAQEVLGVIRDNLGTCRLNPDNHEALVTIRRGFHTLKGSGRMVGLTDLGEVAWSVERAMNKWLQEKKPVTSVLLNFIGEAEQSFAGWVEMLQQHGAASIEAVDLVTKAQQIEDGIDLEAAVVAAEQPAEVPITETAPVQELAPEPGLEMAPAPEPVLEMSFELPVVPEQATELEQAPAPEAEQALEMDFELPVVPE